MSENYHVLSNDELCHYGVLGMKWGVRRARKKGTTYEYKSLATKQYEKKAAKTGSASDKRKAKRSAELDRKLQTSAEKMSTGKTAAKYLLAGAFGTKTYEVAKATGQGRAISAGAAVGASYLGGPLGNMLANDLLRSEYVRR